MYEILARRRSVRMFSGRPVSRETIENLILAAGTAPSGAHKQPWRFVAVQDPAIKREIRMAAEAEERELYHSRANAEWLGDLAVLGTDEHKPFIEIAPWLVAVFKLARDDAPGRRSDQVYYVNESVGIAVGLFLAAAHMAGLATLTHTPSPMKFLARILRRPEHERPYLLIPVGYPATDCVVPDLLRKPLDQIMAVDRPGEPPRGPD
jgi:nitroreductase